MGSGVEPLGSLGLGMSWGKALPCSVSEASGPWGQAPWAAWSGSGGRGPPRWTFRLCWPCPLWLQGRRRGDPPQALQEDLLPQAGQR